MLRKKQRKLAEESALEGIQEGFQEEVTFKLTSKWSEGAEKKGKEVGGGVVEIPQRGNTIEGGLKSDETKMKVAQDG